MERIVETFGELTLETPPSWYSPRTTIYGTKNDDKPLQGTAINDDIFALDGNDWVYGYGGDDRLFGGNGNDRLLGGDGNDYLAGEAGVDHLDGGAGDDI